MGQPVDIASREAADAAACTRSTATVAGDVEFVPAPRDEPGVIAAFGTCIVSALGVADTVVVDHAGLAAQLAPLTQAMTSVSGEPIVTLLLPDAVEALVALGRLDEAEPLVELLEARGRDPDGAWAEAVGTRCRALLLAAQGRADEALAAFEQAVAAHDRLPDLRYDRARTLLVYGRHQRRRRQRRAAQASLEEAAALFDKVGCRQWADSARVELSRLGLRPGAGDGLTAAEQQVAELAGSGLTVREVATALIVSPKTVEAHLTRIYRKLGIHTRAELGQVMAITSHALQTQVTGQKGST